MDNKVIKKDEKIKSNLATLYKNLYGEIEAELIQLGIKYGDSDGNIKISDLNKYRRLTMLKEEIETKITLKHKDSQTMIITDLIDKFETGFYDTLAFMQGQGNIYLGGIFLNDELIQTAIDHKIKKITLSDRLERNRKILIKDTIKVISSNLVLGQGVAKIAKQLKGMYEGDLNKSLNISRTETTRIFNKSKNEAYKEARNKGLEFKEMWLATKGDRTRELHHKLDRTYKNNEGYYTIGKYKAKHPGDFGFPEMDCRCRCTTIAVFD